MWEVPEADNVEIIRTMAQETVYLETSVISYRTARPSSDLMAAAWQKATVDWWDTQRSRSSARSVRPTGTRTRKYAHPRSSWELSKMADEIIRELWRIKDEIAREYRYNLDALVAHLRDESRKSGRSPVDLSSSRARAERDSTEGTPRTAHS